MYLIKKIGEYALGEAKKKTAVNSCNEWNPLKQVIDGRADGAMVQAPEIEIRR